MILKYFHELNKLNETWELEEVFETHDELNQQLFDNDILRKDIRKRLLEIVDLFIGKIREDNIPIDVIDYWLLGSNAAYNYGPKSDIDIHIIVNMEDLGVDPYILQVLYNYIKSDFNNKYDIEVKGHEVELYLEDVRSGAVTNGIYSLKQNRWIKFPTRTEYMRFDVTETDEYKDWYQRYLELEDDEIEQFINDLYLMRKESLATEGEWGTGNLVFKEFRNQGYLDSLKDRKYKYRSRELTLENLLETRLAQENRIKFHKKFKESFLCLLRDDYEKVLAKEQERHGQTYLKIYLCKQRGITYSPSLHVHHIDGDHTNIVDSNLVVLTPSEHKKLHEDALEAALKHILEYPNFSNWTKKKVHSDLTVDNIPQDIFLSAG